MYTRFKDDIEIAMESLGKGCKMGTGKLVEELKVREQWKLFTKLLMKLLLWLSFTVETPCNFDNGKQPVLDVIVRVNEMENNIIE